MFLYAFCHPERSVSAVEGSDRDEKSIVIAWSATPPTPTIAPPYTRCFDYAQHDKSAHTPPKLLRVYKSIPATTSQTPSLTHPYRIVGIIFNTRDVEWMVWVISYYQSQ